MSTVDQFVKRCEKAGAELEKATRSGVNAGALVMAGYVTAGAASVTHGTLVLRGAPKAKLSAKVQPATSTHQPTALVSGTPAGIWTIINRGAKRHVVGAGAGKTGIGRNEHGVIHATTKKGGKSYATKLLSFGPGRGAAYGPFMAGGSPARGTFTAAVIAAHPKVVETVHLESSKAVVRSFR